MPDVLIEDVGKRYVVGSGVVVALDAVDASIPAGSLTALVGVSGSGKSTLLRLIGGLEAPTTGRIDVGGESPTGSVRAFRERVAFVAQRAADNLVPHLTLAEHVDGGDPRAFERLGVAHRAHGRAAQLSGGELARAALAVALARRATVVLVDEPTAELDEGSAEAVLAGLRAAADDGATVVVATHDPAVLAIADNVVELFRGRNAGTPLPPPPPAPAEAGTVALRANALTKAYRGAPVVDGVSLDLRAGELGVVVGRSGSGKSTLLMLLGGWLDAEGGSAELPAGLDWDGLGYVPQRFGLVPELSVEENVALPARLMSRAWEGEALLERLDLADLAARNVTELSIGQQQRVAVARALALRPPVVLADEPTSHQDGASAERVWGELARAASSGAAVLVATHEPDATARAHRSWAIENGRL